MLDGLRFVAALAVVAFHFTARRSPAWGVFQDVPGQLEPLGRWAAYGELGVPLFFVISGFVLLMTAWDKDLLSFVASRVGRLFPAYWVAVVISAIVVLRLWPEEWSILAGRTITKPTALLNLTMVQSAFGTSDIDGPYWTLWYEVRFYALIAVLMLIGITRGRILAFATLWPVVGAIGATSKSALLNAVLMPQYSCYFAGGMLLYLIYRDGHDLGTWLLVGMQCVVGIAGSVPFYKAGQTTMLSFGRSSTLLAVGIAACFGAVALVTLTGLATTRLRCLTFLGALTYPLYLVHENLGWYLIHRLYPGFGPWASVLLAAAISLGVAVCIHLFVERPVAPRLRGSVVRMIVPDAPAYGRRLPRRPASAGAQQHRPRHPSLPLHVAAARRVGEERGAVVWSDDVTARSGHPLAHEMTRPFLLETRDPTIR